MCSFLMALHTPYRTAATLGIKQTKLIFFPLIDINPTPKRRSSGLRVFRL